MIQTIEAEITEKGDIHVLEPVYLPVGRRVLVTILDEKPIKPLRDIPETALLSESSLAEDWNKPEEDAAWSYLQSVQ